MSAARKVRRHAERRRQTTTPRDVLAAAVDIANTIGPHAARHGCVVAIALAGTGGLVEVTARDRVTGEVRCWGCGIALDGPVTGVTRMGPAVGEIALTVQTCDACWEPEQRVASGGAS